MNNITVIFYIQSTASTVQWALEIDEKKREREKEQSLGIKPTTERVHVSSRMGKRQREIEMLGIKCITNGLLWFCGFPAQCIALDLLHRSKGVCLCKYTKKQECICMPGMRMF